MFVVTVNFQIKSGRMEKFLHLMLENARISKDTEIGCQMFDVCRHQDEIFLYEVYETRAAFDLHLGSDHFKEFDRKVADMIAEKHVRLFEDVMR